MAVDHLGGNVSWPGRVDFVWYRCAVKPYWTNNIASLYLGDVRQVLDALPEQSAHTCVTSPPYWGLRDYGNDGQLGLEETPEAYIENMVDVFCAVWRVLRDDGTLWLNLGDSYASSSATGQGGWDGKNKNPDGTLRQNRQAGDTWARQATAVNGLKPKDLVGIPWRVALALQADGWYLRSDIIWAKPNPMPESVTDRPTKSHEYLFLLTKQPRYYYDHEAIMEKGTDESAARYLRNSSYGAGNDKPYAMQQGSRGTKSGKNERSGDPRKVGFNERWKNRPASDLASGMNGHSGYVKADGTDTYTGWRNKRTVWEVTTQPYSEAHFATFPEKLVEPCILAGSPEGGTVLDPFSGSGTSCLVANRLGRKSIGIDLNAEYLDMAIKRISSQPLSMFV